MDLVEWVVSGDCRRVTKFEVKFLVVLVLLLVSVL
jgi:hypothetical protein